MEDKTKKDKDLPGTEAGALAGGCFLTTARQRFEFLFAMAIVHLLDNAVSDNLVGSGVLSSRGDELVALFEKAGGILLVVLGIATFVAIIKPVNRLIVPAVTGYLSFAVVHLGVNIGAILLTAENRKGQALTQLWDVVVVYFMGIFVFTVWYWLLDRVTPGGAFIFPGKPANPCDRSLVDYLFLSFNTSATFGPTSETPTLSSAKVLMMLQVCFSLIVLTVLLARALAG